MTNVDLFDDSLAGACPVPPARTHGARGAPSQQELAIPPAASHGRRPRPAGGPGTEDRHYRLAMRAARRLPRSERRDQTRRLICHHLRCMLEEDAEVPPGRRRVSA